jgi:hypothetical protein
LAGLWFSSACVGAPAAQIFTQVNALDVAYDSESTELRTTLYATNHERFAVICDAEMKTNLQEKLRKTEIRIEPGKTAGFPFSHRRSVKDISLYLMCQAAESQPAAPNDDKRPHDKADYQPLSTPVIIENLDAH